MSNDRIVLDEIIQQQQAERAPDRTASDYFELFVTEQVLKDYDLSAEEIRSGLVGNGGDGGVDSAYLLANGELVRDDFDPKRIKKGVALELVLIQTKTKASFEETPVERFLLVSSDILDLSKPVPEPGVYNVAVVDFIARFKSTYRALASKFPSLKISYYYACKGDKPSKAIQHKAQVLRAAAQTHFSSANVDLVFLGATQLLVLVRKTAQTSFKLNLAENPVSVAGEVGFVGLVYLRDYFDFIKDEKARLRRSLFEANVRDYQGKTAVNKEIQHTLGDRTQEDFWWLNNGVTILASRASHSAKSVTIENPEIVNGLQTSSEIFQYFTALKSAKRDERTLLVRIIVPSDEASRDRIIKATNSQTAIQPASLRATDKIHRDIEAYLLGRGLFYDRRKNYYKNDGKALDSIIGIPQLAQATMAIVLAKPDQARARPTTLLKQDKDYNSVYNPKYPIRLYLVCTVALKRVESFLASTAGLDARDRNNLRFYLTMHVVYLLAGKWQPEPKVIGVLDHDKIEDTLLATSLAVIRAHYRQLGGSDVVAKGSELVNSIKESFPK